MPCDYANDAILCDILQIAKFGLPHATGGWCGQWGRGSRGADGVATPVTGPLLPPPRIPQLHLCDEARDDGGARNPSNNLLPLEVPQLLKPNPKPECRRQRTPLQPHQSRSVCRGEGGKAPGELKKTRAKINGNKRK